MIWLKVMEIIAILLMILGCIPMILGWALMIYSDTYEDMKYFLKMAVIGLIINICGGIIFIIQFLSK